MFFVVDEVVFELVEDFGDGDCVVVDGDVVLFSDEFGYGCVELVF